MGMDEKRLVRIESKITRMSIGLGLDSEGNPPIGAVVGKELMDEVIATIDNYLNLLDGRSPTAIDDAEYDRAESLFNRLVGIRRARWENEKTQSSRAS